MRKAQGMEMNAMIFAALALVFIFIMILIFSGKIQVLGTSSECLQRGGECQATQCNFVQTGYTCEGEKEICCMDPLKIS